MIQDSMFAALMANCMDEDGYQEFHYKEKLRLKEVEGGVIFF
jgi:hypothetical protein